MRRGRGGGSSPASASVVNRKLLSRRLELYKHDCSTVDDLVRRLCETFPEYRRIKRHPFANAVRETLESFSEKERKERRQLPSSSSQDDSDDDDDKHERVGSSRKKSRRADVMEERLQRFENDYIRRKRPRSSEEASSTEPDDDDDGDEEDGVKQRGLRDKTDSSLVKDSDDAQADCSIEYSSQAKPSQGS